MITLTEITKKTLGGGSDAPDELSETGYDLRVLLKPITRSLNELCYVSLTVKSRRRMLL